MNIYPDDVIDEVRASNDIVDVISEYIQLKKKGRNYFGNCPFHNEKTPSFSVSPEKQIFHCFGCNEGGNVITFIMKIENLTFFDAVKFLANRARITLPEETLTEEHKKIKSEKERLYDVNKEAARFFYQSLISEIGLTARNYLNKRGIDAKTIKKFGLGYSPKEWSTLYNYLLNKGFSQKEMLKAGLIKESEKGTFFDMFRNRVMFPIFDSSSNIIAFGGRTLKDDKPKYLNTSETMIFNKGNNLYAYNFSKNSKSTKVIIVEGYMDVIALHQYGVDFAVASLGTALTENQAKLLRRHFEEVIVAYDSDTAGQSATLRGIEILNAKGFDVKILQLPDGKDPDEFVRKHGITSFVNLLDNCKTYMQLKIDLLKKDFNLKKVEDKIKFLSKVSSVLSKIDNTIERDAYIKVLSEQTGISVDSIIAYINKKIYDNGSNLKSIKTPKSNIIINNEKKDDKVDYAEKLLIYLISQDGIYEDVKNNISLDIFENDINKKIAEIVLEKLNAGKEVEPADIMNLLKDEQEINEVSKIFGRNEVYEDISKAIFDCVEYLSTQKKKTAFSELLKSNKSSINDDIDKIKQLDQLIRNKINSCNERRS